MGCPPVYMVATGQNVMRIARPIMDDGSSAVKLVSAGRMMTSSGGFGLPQHQQQQQQLHQRVVTVNAAALRPTLSSVRPGKNYFSFQFQSGDFLFNHYVSFGYRCSLAKIRVIRFHWHYFLAFAMYF